MTSRNHKPSDRLAVVLLSGGLDSATTLAIAQQAGYRCIAISFAYGQRHRVETEAAKRVAQSFDVKRHVIVPIDLRTFGGSALTDNSIDVPTPGNATLASAERRESKAGDIPITYVPARNTIFLSYALALAETSSAHDIFIGVNAIDYSGYPDCRPEFIRAFETVANLGTKAGIEGNRFTIHTPLIALTKAKIIQRGVDLGVDYAITHSCYDPDSSGHACGRCESCMIRKRGFDEAGIDDPTIYAATAAASSS